MAAGCRDDGIIQYEPKEFAWTMLHVANLDNSGIRPMESNGVEIPARAYGIRVRLLSADARPPWDSGYYSYTNRDSVTDVRIFRIIGAAASDVTHDFTALGNWSTGPRSLDEFTNIPDLPAPLNRNIYPAPTDSLDLLMIGGLDPIENARFVVRLDLKSGKVLTDTTEPVSLY